MIASPPATLIHPVAGGAVHVRCSTRADGDFHIEGDRDALLARRRAFVTGAWSQPDEVHGTDVRLVRTPGEHDFAVADGLVTSLRGAVLGAWVGDCAPIALVGEGGTIGAVHAGWRGAVAGVIDAAIDALAACGERRVHAYLGPCIHPCCYEFGASDLGLAVERFGDEVVGSTRWGTDALDVPALVTIALQRRGVALTDVSHCTGCESDRYWSHRRRAERGRQVMAVWKS